MQTPEPSGPNSAPPGKGRAIVEKSAKLKTATEFFGEHPFVTGVLALLGVVGLVFSIIA